MAHSTSRYRDAKARKLVGGVKKKLEKQDIIPTRNEHRYNKKRVNDLSLGMIADYPFIYQDSSTNKIPILEFFSRDIQWFPR